MFSVHLKRLSFVLRQFVCDWYNAWWFKRYSLPCRISI